MSSPPRTEEPPAKRPRKNEDEEEEDGGHGKEEAGFEEREGELSKEEDGEKLVPSGQEQNDEDKEIRLLEAVSAIQDKLNKVEEEEAREVGRRCATATFSSHAPGSHAYMRSI